MKFLEASSGESLHSILNRQPQVPNELHLLMADLLYPFCDHLGRCLQRQRGTVAQFLHGMGELDSLVLAYSFNYIQPLFDRMPAELYQSLSNDTRRELAVFRERFVLYLHEGRQFRERARALLPERQAILYLPTPKPLA